MRVATRVSLATGTLLSLFLAVVLLYISYARNLERANRAIGEYHPARTAAAKHTLIPDKAYSRISRYFTIPSVAWLLETQGLYREGRQQAAIIVRLCHEDHEAGGAPCGTLHDDPICSVAHAGQDIIALWDAMATRTAFYSALSQDEPPDASQWSLELVSAILTDIKRRSERVEDSLDIAIQKKLEVAAEQRASTERIAVFMTAIAIASALFFVWLTIRSFVQPMRELQAATRAVAEGQFRYKLDTSARNEFSGLSASFNRMVTKIAELDQLKSEFLSHISHELRTPLAAMQETTNLLLDETPGPVTAKQRRLLELTNQNCRRLTTMITQLLDLSRMDRGALSYENQPLDFRSLVETATASQSRKAEEVGVELDCDLPRQPVIVHGDPDRLTQVLENLLTNAIKFSARDGSVALRLILPSHGDHPRMHTPSGASTDRDLLCSISDRGPGVPDLHKEKIFEKFHQVDRRPKGSGGGIGLGLAICREIIAAHDGEIWVADHEGPGSTFYFTLPASRLDLTGQGSLT